MNSFKLFAAGIGLAVVAVPTVASAQPWQSINQRQANLDRRIDQGVRNGALTRREAVQLRSEFRQIAFLEARYRRSAPGLTLWERRDLDRRLNVLSRKIRIERNDRQNRRWR